MAPARQKLMKLSITVVATTTFVFGDMAPVISEGPSTHRGAIVAPPTYRRSSNGTQTAIVQVLMLKSADVSAGHIWAIRVQSRTNQGKAAPHRRETHLGRVPTSKMLSSPV